MLISNVVSRLANDALQSMRSADDADLRLDHAVVVVVDHSSSNVDNDTDEDYEDEIDNDDDDDENVDNNAVFRYASKVGIDAGLERTRREWHSMLRALQTTNRLPTLAFHFSRTGCELLTAFAFQVND